MNGPKLFLACLAGGTENAAKESRGDIELVCCALHGRGAESKTLSRLFEGLGYIVLAAK